MGRIEIEEVVKFINKYKNAEEFKESRRDVVNMDIDLTESETQKQL